MKQKQIFFTWLVFVILLVTGCSTMSKKECDNAPPRSINCEKIPNAHPQTEPLCRYGNPECYDVDGQKYYVLKTAQGYCKTGLASWYGTKFHGRNTSSREPYNMFAMTAASRNLPLPTYVEVTNLENGKTIVVKVNDRGPFKSDRIIDLSYAAASKLGFANKGTANVQVKAIDVHHSNEEQQILFAHNESIPEVQINPIALPSPSQSAKAVKLSRYLQVGAFANHDNALKLQEKIAQYTQANVLIKEGQANHKMVYRVQIGPFSTAEESNAIMDTLKAQGYDHVITVFS
ncbi:MAG: septal ring lytic transglycosylase RlpA family protein [Gammaproteobacteria bacterium]|nr:septal ring lytic transglycosylase RlpA family protein [Gammaproteobacteria bacterium]